MSRRREFVHGAEVVERAFRGISKKAAEKIAVALNKSGAELVVKAKQIHAPSKRTEEILRGIEALPIEKREDGKGIRKRVGVFPKLRGGRAWYARYLEFGVPPHRVGRGSSRKPGGAFGGGHHPGIPKGRFSFLFPAYWALRNRIRARINHATSAAVKEAFHGRR